MITQGNMAVFGLSEQKRPEYWVSQLPAQRASDSATSSINVGGEVILQRMRIALFPPAESAAATAAIGETIVLHNIKKRYVDVESVESTVTIGGTVTLQSFKKRYDGAESAAATLTIGEVILDKGGIIRAHEQDSATATIEVTNIYLQKV